MNQKSSNTQSAIPAPKQVKMELPKPEKQKPTKPQKAPKEKKVKVKTDMSSIKNIGKLPFGKKNAPVVEEVKPETDDFMIDEKYEVNASVIEDGAYKIKDFIAPPAIYRGEIKDGDWMKIGGKYVRPYVMQGYPSSVRIGWLDDLYNYEGDMDVALHIHPSDDREALESLTNKIVQFESQLELETRKGSIRNVTKLENTISLLYEQRAKLEQSQESLFNIQVACNLYAGDMQQLDKETQKLENRLKGRKMALLPTYLRQDEGYKTSLPIGKTFIPDKMRNFNTGALTTTFPFYHSDISHPRGIFIGSNAQTGSPINIDFFDKALMNNANATVFGKAGSGKTFFVSCLTMRSAARGIHTVIIDPEGEYIPVTKAMGGAHIFIAADSKEFINPFDVESEFEKNEETGQLREYIDLKSKFGDVLNLVAIMNQGLTNDQRAIVAMVIANVYEKFGITSDPKSLRVAEKTYDEKTETMYQEGQTKRMPQFSDFHEELEKEAINQKSAELQRLVTSLRMFKKGGIYDMFDTQTSPGLSHLTDRPVITFNISRLEESILRPIGMYVALSWTWEKFVKKNPENKKRVVCDEAWMLVNKNMAGHEYSANFLENAARRIRKRNGGLLVASQNFREFDESEQGKAVLTNATVKFFLQQDSTDIQLVRKKFNLSDGESNFLLRAKRGQMLIRIKDESAVCNVVAFDKEKELIDKAKNYIGGIGVS